MTPAPGYSVRWGAWLQPLVIALTLGVFALALLLVGYYLRNQVRSQILHRDGAVLNAIALMRQYSETSLGEDELLVEDPLDELALILETSSYRPARAIRFFDAHGGFITAIPAAATSGELAPDDLRRLTNGIPVQRYLPRAQLSDYLLSLPDATAPSPRPVPLMEVLVPIPPDRPDRLVGVTQFILDGQEVSQELATLDRHLLVHAAIVFLLSGGLIAGTLIWAFQQLQQRNRLLGQQATQLARANQELALAAKMTAVGAMTAHLVHGLKNPLSGLRHLVASHRSTATKPTDTDWQHMVNATGRMQNLVNDIVRVLSEEKASLNYQVELKELAEILTTRVGPAAEGAQVQFQVRLNAQGILSNRQANLILLILENLLQNALDATPAGHQIDLNLHQTESALVFTVADQGPGLPDYIKATLFTPCQSTKPGGSGIGLAICKQLADQLGATINLESSSPTGSVFSLRLPFPQ